MKTVVLSAVRSILWVMFLILVIWFVTHGSLAQAATPRGKAAPAAFKKANPCPATGKTSGACPGWVMDHIIPLYCNGPDSPSNLQWQTRAESEAKDRWELQCWRYYQGPR